MPFELKGFCQSAVESFHVQPPCFGVATAAQFRSHNWANNFNVSPKAKKKNTFVIKLITTYNIHMQNMHKIDSVFLFFFSPPVDHTIDRTIDYRNHRPSDRNQKFKKNYK